MSAFLERSRISKRLFEVVGSTLTIRGKVHFRKVDLRFDLKDITVRIERLRLRDYRVINRSIMFGFAFGIVALAIWPAHFTGAKVIAAMFGYIALNFGWVAIRWISPIEVERYFNHGGVLAFDIVREKAQGPDFDEFTTALRAAIEKSANEPEPNKAPEPTPTAVTPRAIE